MEMANTLKGRNNRPRTMPVLGRVITGPSIKWPITMGKGMRVTKGANIRARNSAMAIARVKGTGSWLELSLFRAGEQPGTKAF